MDLDGQLEQQYVRVEFLTRNIQETRGKFSRLYTNKGKFCYSSITYQSIIRYNTTEEKKKIEREEYILLL
jgi:hypothetical protein